MIVNIFLSKQFDELEMNHYIFGQILDEEDSVTKIELTAKYVKDHEFNRQLNMIIK